MSKNRRRACVFTLSANSFQSGTSSERNVDSEGLQAFSDDSLNTGSRDASYKKNASAPDLNARIPLSPTENSNGYTAQDPRAKFVHTVGKDRSCGKENENPQCSASNGQPVAEANVAAELQINASSNRDCTKSSSRDTNFNIKQINDRQHNNSSKAECNRSNESRQNISHGAFKHAKIDYEKAKSDYLKFESMLCFLDNQLNEMEEESPQKIFKRLSHNFNNSPTNFTERLLTIIEESVINDEAISPEAGVNLSRLTTEFKKMCKFIEDETAPEWPPSPLLTPPYCNQTAADTSTPNTDCIKSPFKKVHSSYKEHLKSRRLYRLSKSLSTPPVDNLTNVSVNQTFDDSFERLEAQCNKLFKNTMGTPKLKHKPLSLTLLKSMENIYKMCEQQMASLDTTNAMITDKTTNPTVKNMAQEQQHTSKPQQYPYTESGNGNEDGIIQSMNTEDLDTTIMYDLAEKRKRCMDTVKLLMDIKAEPQEEQSQSPISNDEAKFFNTLISCKEYYVHLHQQKPLFNFLRTELSTIEIDSDHSPINSCSSGASVIYSSMKSPAVQNLKIPTSGREQRKRKFFISPESSPVSKPYLSPRMKSGTNKAGSNLQEQKPKFFPTSGKTGLSTPRRKKQVLFPSMHKEAKKTPDFIRKSPNTYGLCRPNYNNVVSPVGMYIRGTDTQLLKNVQGKTDNLLLEPTKQKFNKPPSSPSIRKIQLNSPKLSPTINSTPKSSNYKTNKLSSPIAAGNDCVLPKVNYKLPAQVHTVKDNGPKDTRQHIKTLLQSTHSKVIIHHQGRIPSTNASGQNVRNNLGDTINHNSEDESIHVVQAASKTNCFQKKFQI